MIKSKKLVFWQQTVSHHQWPFQVALQVQNNCDVTIATSKNEIEDERIQMGWPTSQESGLTSKYVQTPHEANSLLDETRDAHHVFSHVFHPSVLQTAFFEALKRNHSVSMLSEPPMPSHIPMAVKYLGHKEMFRRYGKSIKRVFAIGHMGVEWYRKIGYSAETVVPWGYFPPSSEDQLTTPDQIPHIMYFGQLHPRKGVVDLAHALTKIQDRPWKMSFYGQGPDLEEIKRIVAPLHHRVTISPYLPYQKAMQTLGRADLALVPSRHDGWGVVVNEALARGVPVICTDRVGAQDLIVDQILGEVVPVANPRLLAEAITRRLACRPVTLQDRADIKALSTRFSPENGAQCMFAALENPGQITPPWRQPAPVIT